MCERGLFELDGVAWPHREASSLVSVGGTALHVQRLGRGPQVLLIHGTGASTHSWHGLYEQLSKDFELVAIDLPGHGFSAPIPPAEMTPNRIARRLEALLATLGTAPRLIVAHSAGAVIAVRMALDAGLAPLLRIVAINGALLPFNGMARLLFAPAARFLAATSLPAHLLARCAEHDGTVERLLAGTGGRLTPQSARLYRALLRQPQHIQATLDMMANWSLDSMPHDLARLTIPLELIACGDDQAVPAESAWAVKRQAREACVHYLRDLGHLGHEERPDVVAAIIRKAALRAGLLTAQGMRNPDTTQNGQDRP